MAQKYITDIVRALRTKNFVLANEAFAKAMKQKVSQALDEERKTLHEADEKPETRNVLSRPGFRGLIHESWQVKNVANLLNDMEDEPRFKKYDVTKDDYDSVQFAVPLDVFKSVTGLGEREIKKINDNTDNFEGDIEVVREGGKTVVKVWGGS